MLLLCMKGGGSVSGSAFLALPAWEVERRLEFETDASALQKDSYSDTRGSVRFCNTKVSDSNWEPLHSTSLVLSWQQIKHSVKKISTCSASTQDFNSVRLCVVLLRSVVAYRMSKGQVQQDLR